MWDSHQTARQLICNNCPLSLRSSFLGTNTKHSCDSNFIPSPVIQKCTDKRHLLIELSKSLLNGFARSEAAVYTHSAFQTTHPKNFTPSLECLHGVKLQQFSPLLNTDPYLPTSKYNLHFLIFLQLKGQATVNSTERGEKHTPTPALGQENAGLYIFKKRKPLGNW